MQQIKVGIPLTRKQLERECYMEAVGYYTKWFLEPIVELYRLRYCPEKADFWIKHIERDLPKQAIAKLKPMFIFDSLEDLHNHLDAAERLSKAVFGQR